MANCKIVNTHITHSMAFDGDIIITDPCYILNRDNEDDWDRSHCGSNMKALGINHYITRDTLYGDWGCTVFDLDTKEEIGRFCADTGLVSVFLLDEVLKYNPNFDYYTTRPWTTTLIKDFRGIVEFTVRDIQGEYEETTEYHQKGDKFEDRDVQVIGKGINKATSELFRFVGKQTGF